MTARLTFHGIKIGLFARAGKETAMKNGLKAGFPLGEFVRANRERSNLIGWRQTLTTSPANHIRFLLVRANKFAKWKTGFKPAICDVPGLVVQSWISPNPSLKLNPVFYSVYFCMSVHFKTSEKTAAIDPDKISEEIFLNSLTSCWEICFEF